MRKQITALLLVCVALLSGCDDDAAKDPTPGANTKQNYESARLATAQIGQPFDLNGCQVQLQEVFITYPGTWPNQSITMATANCPTAKISTTNENCGKSCRHNTVRLEPAADTPAQADASARPVEQAQADAQAQARELQRATQIAQLKEKLAQLRKEMDGVSEDLKRMQ